MSTDHSADPGTDYDALIARLDLPAKVALLTGASAFTVPGDERIGLAEMAFSDGPTGVRGLAFTGGEPVALLPNATLLAGAWSTASAYEVGELLAEEGERQHIHVVLGPTINLHRSPLGGRVFEQYSEDPLLTGLLAAAYVRGLQSRGVGACLKHLVANESETDRNHVDSRVSDEALREVYLLPFEIAVADADPWSIMAAYNDVNGVPATEHDAINNGIVKGEWGWPGLLMSDWFATRTAAAAAAGGLDLVMPGPEGPWGDALVDDVRAGRVDESVIDDHVRRLLRLADRTGALGGERAWRTGLPAPDDPQRRTQLRRLAVAGMVVLANDGVLPLAPDTSVALIGRHAVATVCMGGGSATVNPPHQVSVAEGLRAALGDQVSVVDGVPVHDRPQPAARSVVTDPETGEPGVRVRFYDDRGELLADRPAHGATISMGWDDDFARPAVRATFSARLAAGPAHLGAIGTGAWRLLVDDEPAAEFTLTADGHDPGETMIRPPGRTLPGTVAAGALVTAEVTLVPTEPRRGPDGRVSIPERRFATGMGAKALVVEPVPASHAEVFAAATAAARAADVAVVVVGLTTEQETEAVDKATLALPGDQDALVSAVAAVARRTVVVLNAATPVLMPWAGEVDAILVAGLPGQEGGHAVADALLGIQEPTGRLVTSYPAADGAAPGWQVVPTDRALGYGEGTFVGYRGYHAGLAQTPAFWFGHGLGYGSWEYGDAHATDGPGAPQVTVTIRNTGDRASREVVQVYFRPDDTGQPVRLVGWSAATVAPGEQATVTVETDPRLWRRWTDGSWTELGDGELLVARGLGDVRLRLPVARHRS